ncbi:MAG: AsnC family transcriptional regulator [Desulfobacterales bacterium]
MTPDSLDSVDKMILNRIQSDFPITPEPYKAIAEEVGLGEAEVISRLARLKKQGIIRRIGGNFVPSKVGYVSTLCAAKVPKEKIEAFAAVVNGYPGVTHNYLRSGEVNIWFTLIAPSMAEIESALKAISEKTGIDDILNLPATRKYKIKAHFNL